VVNSQVISLPSPLGEGLGVRLLRHRIVPTTTPRVASQQTPHGQGQAFERTMLYDGLTSILGTARGKTTRGRSIGGDGQLIEADGQ
jgi:hypothetical protein